VRWPRLLCASYDIQDVPEYQTGPAGADDQFQPLPSAPHSRRNRYWVACLCIRPPSPRILQILAVRSSWTRPGSAPALREFPPPGDTHFAASSRLEGVGIDHIVRHQPYTDGDTMKRTTEMVSQSDQLSRPDGRHIIRKKRSYPTEWQSARLSCVSFCLRSLLH